MALHIPGIVETKIMVEKLLHKHATTVCHSTKLIFEQGIFTYLRFALDPGSFPREGGARARLPRPAVQAVPVGV